MDLIDCSGSGDVDTTVIRTVQDGILLGLTGRQLIVSLDFLLFPFKPFFFYHLLAVGIHNWLRNYMLFKPIGH